jgi:hypothetical protein
MFIRFLSFLIGLFGLSDVFAQPILPSQLKQMPVLIQIQTTSKAGTGIYLVESNKWFLITAAHCIFKSESTNRSELLGKTATISSLGSNDNGNEKSQYFLDLQQLNDEGLIKRHLNHDVAVVLLGVVSTHQTNNGATIALSRGVRQLVASPFQTLTFTITNCMLFTNIPEGSDSYILDYPVNVFNPLFQSEIDFTSPLFRTGIISQKNTRTGELIIDSGVYGGNSGGPVVIIQHPSSDVTAYSIGGLITQFVPVLTMVTPQIGTTNSVLVSSGYGVAEPIDYAVELMHQ